MPYYQINAIFVIIAITKLTQAGKIPFINTILFGSHILSDEFFGYLIWAYKPQKMGKMVDTIQYSFSANKKNSDLAFSYAHLNLILSAFHCKTDTVQLRFVWLLVALTSQLAYALTRPSKFALPMTGFKTHPNGWNISPFKTLNRSYTFILTCTAIIKFNIMFYIYIPLIIVCMNHGIA